MTLMQWLQTRWEENLPFEYPEHVKRLPAEPTRLDILACLVALNGGRFLVTGCGVTSCGGPYGHTGLEMKEGLTLIEMSAFVSGMLEATGGAEKESFHAAINAEHARVFALMEAEEPPAPAGP